MRGIQTIGAFVPPTTAMLYSPYMATKTQTKKSKVTLDSVLSAVERSFADLEGKMDRGFAAVAEDITDIKSKMATKDDINRLDTKLTKFEEHEIDKRLQLEVRVSIIEKHAGLDKKIAA
jgi:gas vesicle protein